MPALQACHQRLDENRQETGQKKRDPKGACKIEKRDRQGDDTTQSKAVIRPSSRSRKASSALWLFIDIPGGPPLVGESATIFDQRRKDGQDQHCETGATL